MTIVAGAAAMALVALDMVTSGDPHPVEWLVLLLPFFLGLGLVVAAPVVLAFRLREDGCWAQGGALAASLAVLVHVVSGTCPTLLYRLGGDDVAALAVLLPTALAPLLAAGAGLLLASRFGYLNQYAWVVCIGLGLLAVLAASHVPALAGPGLLLAIDGPLLAGTVWVTGPVRPGSPGPCRARRLAATRPVAAEAGPRGPSGHFPHDSGRGPLPPGSPTGGCPKDRGTLGDPGLIVRRSSG